MNEHLKKLLQDAEQAHFWGAIELEYKDGQVTTVRKTETTKLISRRGNVRDGHEENNYRR